LPLTESVEKETRFNLVKIFRELVEVSESITLFIGWNRREHFRDVEKDRVTVEFLRERLIHIPEKFLRNEKLSSVPRIREIFRHFCEERE